MSEKIREKSIERGMNFLEALKKSFQIGKEQEEMLSGMFEKIFMEGNAYSEKKERNERKKKSVRFGNLLIIFEPSEKLDYYKLTDLTGTFSIRWRQDTRVFMMLENFLKEADKRQYLDNLFTIQQLICTMPFISPVLLEKIGMLIYEDAMGQPTLTEEENQKIIKEEKENYEVEHEVHQPTKDKKDD